MDSTIQNFIQMCEWDSSRFLIFSDNVFGSLIYYSHLFAIVLSLFIGVVVFLSGRKILTNRLLSSMMFLFAVWAFGTPCLVGKWKTRNSNALVSYSVGWTIDICSGCSFVHTFIKGGGLSFGKKIAIFLPILPIILLLPTNAVLQGFDLTNCYREPVEGIISTYYVYFIEVIYIIWITLFAFVEYRKSKLENKRQIVFITIGLILFLLSFISGNIIGSITEDWTLAQIGLFSLPIFATMLAYMIVKFRSFNMKVLGAQILVFSIGFLILGINFINSIENVRSVSLATLLLVVIVG